MKKIIFSIVFLLAPITSVADDNQKTTGDNSPIISNVKGNVVYDNSTTTILEAPKKEDYIPILFEKPYPEARKLLIENGWIPQLNRWSHKKNIGSGNAEFYWEKEFYELETCAGTGYGECLFEFTNPKGYFLVIITQGEVSEAMVIDGKQYPEHHAVVRSIYLNPSDTKDIHSEENDDSRITMKDENKVLNN